MRARSCIQQHHDWQLVDPDEPPPRRWICRHCGKHVPPEPSDTDYAERAELL